MDILEASNLTFVSKNTVTKCNHCGICVKSCAFLKEYGTPAKIAEKVLSSPDGDWPDPFECSLCGLCGAVCSEGLKPEELFLEMRRARTEVGALNLKQYRPVLSFEKLGDSNLFSFLRLPEGGDTVLFPGCALPVSRSKTVRRLFVALQSVVPDIGVALGCCLKPSHDLGRAAFFEDHFGRLHDALAAAGVRRVLTACPSCQKVFSSYGGNITSTTVYEVLAQSDFRPETLDGGDVVIHDPCPQRYETVIQDAVRSLAAACSLSVTDLAETRELTPCCGEGGMVKFVCPNFAEQWTEQRTIAANGRRIVTSCAGCVNYLGESGEVDHILDVLFDSRPEKKLKPPFTYWARLRLKKWFKKILV